MGLLITPIGGFELPIQKVNAYLRIAHLAQT